MSADINYQSVYIYNISERTYLRVNNQSGLSVSLVPEVFLIEFNANIGETFAVEGDPTNQSFSNRVISNIGAQTLSLSFNILSDENGQVLSVLNTINASFIDATEYSETKYWVFELLPLNISIKNETLGLFLNIVHDEILFENTLIHETIQRTKWSFVDKTSTGVIFTPNESNILQNLFIYCKSENLFIEKDEQDSSIFLDSQSITRWSMTSSDKIVSESSFLVSDYSSLTSIGVKQDTIANDAWTISSFDNSSFVPIERTYYHIKQQLTNLFASVEYDNIDLVYRVRMSPLNSTVRSQLWCIVKPPNMGSDSLSVENILFVSVLGGKCLYCGIDSVSVETYQKGALEFIWSFVGGVYITGNNLSVLDTDSNLNLINDVQNDTRRTQLFAIEKTTNDFLAKLDENVDECHVSSAIMGYKTNNKHILDLSIDANRILNFDFSSNVINSVSCTTEDISANIANNNLHLIVNPNIITNVNCSNENIIIVTQNSNNLTIQPSPSVVIDVLSSNANVLDASVISNCLEIQLNPNIVTSVTSSNSKLLEPIVSGNILSLQLDSHLVNDVHTMDDIILPEIRENMLILFPDKNIVNRVISANSLLNIEQSAHNVYITPSYDIVSMVECVDPNVLNVTIANNKLKLTPSQSIVINVQSDRSDLLQATINDNLLSLNLNETIVTSVESSNTNILLAEIVREKLSLELCPTIVTNVEAASPTKLSVSHIGNNLVIDLICPIVSVVKSSDNAILTPSIIENELTLLISNLIVTHVTSNNPKLIAQIDANTLILSLDESYEGGGGSGGSGGIANILSSNIQLISIDNTSSTIATKLVISNTIVNTVDSTRQTIIGCSIQNNNLSLNVSDQVVAKAVSRNVDVISTEIADNILSIVPSATLVNSLLLTETLLTGSIDSNVLSIGLDKKVVGYVQSSMEDVVKTTISDNKLTLSINPTIVTASESSNTSIISTSIDSATHTLLLTPSPFIVTSSVSTNMPLIGVSILNNKLTINPNSTIVSSCVSSNGALLSSSIQNNTLSLNLSPTIVSVVKSNNVNILSANVVNNVLSLTTASTIVSIVQSSNQVTLGVSIANNILSLTPSATIVTSTTSSASNILKASIVSNNLKLEPSPTLVSNAASSNLDILKTSITSNTLNLNLSPNIVTIVKSNNSSILNASILNNLLSLSLSAAIVSSVQTNIPSIMTASIVSNQLLLTCSSNIVSSVQSSASNIISGEIIANTLKLTPSNTLVTRVVSVSSDLINAEIVDNTLTITGNENIVTSVQSTNNTLLSVSVVGHQVVLSPSSTMVNAVFSSNLSVLGIDVQDNTLNITPSPNIVNKVCLNGNISGYIKDNVLDLTVPPAVISLSLTPGMFGSNLEIDSIDIIKPDTLQIDIINKKLTIDLILKTLNQNSIYGTGDIKIDKYFVLLDQVDNTSDTMKPVSVATQLLLDKKLESYDVYKINNVSIKGIGDLQIDKQFIGLPRVDNTSDIEKPVSLLTQQQLNGKQEKSDQIVTSCQTTPQDSFTSSIFGNKLSLGLTLKTVNGFSLFGLGDVRIDKTLLKLENIDNTPDVSKPISTLQQQALDTKVTVSPNIVTSFSSSTPFMTGSIVNNMLSIDHNLKTLNNMQLHGTGDLKIDRAYFNIDNTDNTRDIDKPVSRFQQTELDKKQDKIPNLVTTVVSESLNCSIDTNNTLFVESKGIKTLTSALLVNYPLDGLGNVVIDQAFVGLEHVENSRDIDKPISSKTQIALDQKEPQIAVNNRTSYLSNIFFCKSTVSTPVSSTPSLVYGFADLTKYVHPNVLLNMSPHITSDPSIEQLILNIWSGHTICVRFAATLVDTTLNTSYEISLFVENIKVATTSLLALASTPQRVEIVHKHIMGDAYLCDFVSSRIHFTIVSDIDNVVPKACINDWMVQFEIQ